MRRVLENMKGRVATRLPPIWVGAPSSGRRAAHAEQGRTAIMECAFCAQFAASDYEWIITENDGWVLLPTIGCFTPGYCLFMPLDHIDAAADMAPTSLIEIEAMAEQARARIE